MSGFPLPPGVKETAAAIWLGVKTALPDSCLAAADEKFSFAKNKQGSPPQQENMEMTAVNGEGVPGTEGGAGMARSRGGSTSTVGVESSDHDAITEWQAGWNVTNAIQVNSTLILKN